MKFDMHVHSRRSHDGHMTPQIIIAAAQRAGLSGLAICDHNTLSGSQEAQAVCPSDFVVIPGAEYSTDVGHVLAYFISHGAEDADLPRLPDGRFLLTDLARFIRAQGGLLVAAHPYRHRDKLPRLLMKETHGMEVFNARQLARYPATTTKTMQAARTQSGFFTAGSDAHVVGELGCAYMEINARTVEGIRQALTSGHYICYGRPAKRRYEAIGRLGAKGVKGVPKDFARLLAFCARDVKDALLRSREWEMATPTG